MAFSGGRTDAMTGAREVAGAAGIPREAWSLSSPWQCRAALASMSRPVQYGRGLHRVLSGLCPRLLAEGKRRQVNARMSGLPHRWVTQLSPLHLQAVLDDDGEELARQ